MIIGTTLICLHNFLTHLQFFEVWELLIKEKYGDWIQPGVFAGKLNMLLILESSS